MMYERYSGGNKYLIPCRFCKFILTVRHRISNKKSNPIQSNANQFITFTFWEFEILSFTVKINLPLKL